MPDSHAGAGRRSILPVRYDARLVEEVVGAELRRREAAGQRDTAAAYHVEREGLYRLPSAGRDVAFARLHRRLFRDLGFEPRLAGGVTRHAAALAVLPALTIRRASSAGDEGADLGPSGPEGRPGVLAIAVARFFDGTLAPFVDHELVHLRDLVDPGFGHDPAALERITAHRRRHVQARYRLAWAASVDGRLAREGRTPLAERGAYRERLGRDFRAPGGPALDDLLQRLWAGPRPTHAELLALAVAASDPAPVDGGACPLCGFPTHRWGTPSPEVIDAVRRDVPQWRAENGLCDRCAERFEVTLAHAR